MTISTVPPTEHPRPADLPSGPARLRRLLARLCWPLAAVWAFVALVRLLGLHVDRWPLAIEPAVVPYAAITAVIPLAVALLSRRWLAAALATAALVALVVVVAPRGFGGPDPVRGPAVRVLTANLREGHADPASVVALARQRRVDVLAIEEVTPPELDRLLAAGLSQLLPYSSTNPQWIGPAGTALFSRYPLTGVGRHSLPHTFTETLATVQPPGSVPVAIDVIHYCAPVDPDQTACWNAGVRSIPPATPHGPVRLLLGDFNMTLDFPDLRHVLSTGYRDAAEVVGEALTPTFPYLGPPLPKVTPDHVLADSRIGISSVSVLPIRDSDHRAVFAALTFPKQG
ncbi:endonuclease/exonuclease/phosphatase family protein [Rugosimonospora acidiphila]|uniref:Endonuclease/exonuclease/phosphatase family protein n=1 Tax=Rugosimonospora acidiphila TaxID=556531 RepID=A0ABP9RWT8_9ACTN